MGAPNLPEGSDAWCQACAARVAIAGASGNAEELIALAGELRHRGLSQPSTALLTLWTTILTPLFYVAKRKDIADKMIRELQLVASADAEGKNRGALWLALLAYARARQALMNGDQLIGALLFDDVVQRFEECGDKKSAALYRVSAGFTCNIIGAYERAERWLREALQTTTALGLSRDAANAKSNLGVTLSRLGQREEAERLEREAIRFFTDADEGYYRDSAQLYLGFIFRDAEAWVDVDAIMTPLATAQTAADIRLCALTTLARSLLARGQPQAAFVQAQLALKVMQALAAVEEGEEAARLILAETALAIGDQSTAVRTIRTARARLLSKAAHAPDLSLRDASLSLREGYLSRVPENLAILTLAKKLLSHSLSI